MRAVFLLFLLLTAPAAAAAPRVVADIAPVASLAARVMAGVGAPETLLPPNASPHHYAMRPSDARRLARVDLVIWVGPALTPWLARAVGEGASLPLADPAGDPHAWLDPIAAAEWLDRIAEALAALDADNAATYRANAAEGRVELKAMTAEIDAALAPLRGRAFVVFHDAYAPFEARFDLPAAAALSPDDGAAVGPAGLLAVRSALTKAEAACLFTEPQFPSDRAATIIDGTGARMGVLDPLGVELPEGAGLYPAMMRGLAASLTGCLGALR